LDARFQATLGGARLRDLRPTGDGALDATVPEDLPAGTHDLVVTDPSGRSGSLPSAYRVVPSTAAEYLVASYRIDPVADQVAFAPFAVTVTALDANGQVVAIFSGTVTVADRTGTVLPATVGPFAWGTWTGPLEVRQPLAADALTVTDALGHVGTSNDFAVAPVAAARIAFTSPPVSAVAGACAGPVTVALEDLYGFATTAPAPVSVAVDDGGGALQVFSDPACAVAAPGATIASGAGSAQVYVRSTVAGPFTLTASGGGLAPAAQAGDVSPAAPERLVFTSPPQTVVAGTCSASATLVLEDAYGNVSPVASGAAVALAATPPSGLQVYDGAGCAGPAVVAVSIPAGGAGATFSFSATASGTLDLGATAAGIPGGASQLETILPAPADRLVFATAPQSVAAGTCSGPATVVARDPLGNDAPAAADIPVSLSAAPAGLAFYAGVGCGGAPVASATIPAGATQATFSFRGTAAGPLDVTAAGAGLALAATQAETIVPAPADRLVFTTAPQSVAAGSCSAVASVEARD
ncbi:MAG TPA: hypothetical protein VIW03_11225, partial [Anaeromyxobacter sp.]